MANTLLDFVMSLVRDPDAAARYAADPAGAIADAHLSDVTSADVNNLIPMVADSLSGPLSGAAFGPGAGAGADGNVWASGAATAAFDAFDAHLPAAVVADTHPVVTDVAQPAGPDPAVIIDPGVVNTSLPDTSVQVTDVGFDHDAVTDVGPDWAEQPAWDHTHVDDTHGAGSDAAGFPAPDDHPGFDLF
ncbi:Rv0340 family protein [Mycobacterium sp. CVI_P3]|uniref:Rv0340 family protein n=1 Tax=Mycobacterium pinniadriaticum TaxID=2994102 RepID=A0ABT3SLB6_9MYCO|nr:Rv0340 family IniB-related protein [Mycobacterium pinniadriaticum]MCX2933861.1 Rv0340 family protein [Mycobacterium pinniadriaticum]MCX2940286.1 Rv0340 family protein [Mycobacterium pinniadriaticum]